VRVLVIYCHPNETSFASALHQTVLRALRRRGHEVTDLDLYAEGFRPVMSREDRQKYEDPAQYREAVEKYALQLAETEAVARQSGWEPTTILIVGAPGDWRGVSGESPPR
jgi:NAD(P)H dehydrogenase (quinone)